MQDFLNNFINISDSSTFLDVVGFVVLKIIFGFAVIGIVMGFAAVSVVIERKVSAAIQGRLGPNRTAIPYVECIPFIGKFLKRNGLMQLVADALKFLLKEEPLPNHVNKFWFSIAPIISLSPVLVAASVIPFGFFFWDGSLIPISPVNIDFSLLFALAVGSLSVYGAVLAGWSSNSKYSYHGCVRASAQVISYELALILSIVPIIMLIASRVENPLSLFEIGLAQNHMWNIVYAPISALIFLIALFAETNRLPFDMAESETDLVSGFFTEYGSFKFGLFFIGEYGHIVVGSSIFITMFLGAWNPLPGVTYPVEWGWIASILSVLTFLIKIFIMIFFFVWIRWTLPRFRYDQVMSMGWKILLPIAIANLLLYMLIIPMIR